MTDTMYDMIRTDEIVFKGDMVVNISSFQNIIDLFAYDYEYMGTELHQTRWIKDLANMVFFQFEEHDKVYHVSLGENTQKIIFYKNENEISVQESEDDDSFGLMESIGFKAFESKEISLIHILRYLMEHHKYPSNTVLPLSFQGVRTILVRDYKQQKEISISIDEVLNI